MNAWTVSGFGEILLFAIGGLVFLGGGLLTSWLLRPSRPNEEKLTTYESGEDPMGSAWGRVNIRFYLIALIFLLFEVEIVFLFPWSTVFGSQSLMESTEGLWGTYALIEMFIFITILLLGLVYAWSKGFLDWPKPDVNKEKYQSPVPSDLYDNINSKYQ